MFHLFLVPSLASTITLNIRNLSVVNLSTFESYMGPIRKGKEFDQMRKDSGRYNFWKQEVTYPFLQILYYLRCSSSLVMAYLFQKNRQ